MNCTKCGTKTCVKDTRLIRLKIVRRRECLKCKTRFSTEEVFVMRPKADYFGRPRIRKEASE